MYLSPRIREVFFIANELITLGGCFFELFLVAHKGLEYTLSHVCNSLVINLFHISLVTSFYMRGGGPEYVEMSLNYFLKKIYYFFAAVINSFYFLINFILSSKLLANEVGLGYSYLIVYTILLGLLMIISFGKLSIMPSILYYGYYFLVICLIQSFLYAPLVTFYFCIEGLKRLAFILPFIFFEVYWTPRTLKLYNADMIPEVSLNKLIGFTGLFIFNLFLCIYFNIDVTKTLSLLFLLPLLRCLRSGYLLLTVLMPIRHASGQMLVYILLFTSATCSLYYEDSFFLWIKDHLVDFLKLNNFIMTPFCLQILLSPRDLYIVNEHKLFNILTKCFCILTPLWTLSFLPYSLVALLPLSLLIIVLSIYKDYRVERGVIFLRPLVEGENRRTLSLTRSWTHKPNFDSLGDTILVRKKVLSMSEIETLLVNVPKARRIIFKEKVDSNTAFRTPLSTLLYGDSKLVSMSLNGLKIEFDLDEVFMDQRTLNEKKELFKLFDTRDINKVLDTTAGIGVFLALISKRNPAIDLVYNDLNPNALKCFRRLIELNHLKKNIKTYVTSYETIPELNADLVVYDNPSVLANLNSLKRYLAPGGTLVIYQEITNPEIFLEELHGLTLENVKKVKSKSKEIGIYRYILRLL